MKGEVSLTDAPLTILESDGELPGGFPPTPTTAELDDLLAGLISVVPRCSVTTPKALATALGDPRAARFVGERLSAMRAGREGGEGDAPPLHRVVLSDGSLRDDPAALSGEGVQVKGGRVVDMEGRTHELPRLPDGGPLATLLEYQRAAAGDVDISHGPRREDVRRVAGVDVSYDRGTDRVVSCCTVMDPAGEEVLEQVAVRTRVTFPYITGYLGFREVPPMALALMALDEKPDAVLVDGHGVLHPRRFGVACQLGVTLGIPTVGCAKRILVGVRGPAAEGEGKGAARPMVLDGEHLGWSMAPRRGSRPAVVSPGHMACVAGARDIVAPLLSHQMPEPIRRSHVASRGVLKRRL
jgi:deoxyribonuclease V